MTWQIGTLVILALALGGGMLWYEQSKPPSQIVALVAVLAALAVAGRIVLAPIPNVVATTDIVFFAGFVLGPAPGFAVGALGGLVSNFWLGQGVWTPWQMVGWGMTGVAGGALCYLTRGRSNRWTLALACGAAGLVFGMWMNFQTMVSYGGEMSLDRYLALEVRAIPFDLAHISGNVIFALVAGPTMVSALQRFRERFEWRQVQSLAGYLLVAIALTTVVAAPNAKAATTDEAALAATWLRAQQNDDGGFPSAPGGDSSVGMTSRAMIGLAAAEVNPLDVRKASISPYGYLVERKNQLNDAGDIALAILALKTVGSDPRNFEDRDLVSALRKKSGKNYSYGNKVNLAAYAAIAFKSVGANDFRERIVGWLRKAENTKKGGWGISDRASPDPDSTGTVLQAYTGEKSVSRAMKFLKSVQKENGGFANSGSVNSQSTGLVVMGSIASGKGAGYPHRYGPSGYDYLVERQQDDGSIWYGKESDLTRVWVTADVLPALAKESLPVKQPPRAADPDESNSDNTGGATPPSGGSTSSSSSTPSLIPSTGSSSSGSSSSGSSDSGSGGSPSGSGNGSGGSSNSGSGTDPGITDTAPPVAEVPVVPVAPTEAVLAASRQGPQPSPLIAILICMFVTGGLAGGTVWLTRRNGW